MHSSFVTRFRIMLVFLAISGFYLVNCCPGSPGCPSIPPTLPPPTPPPTTSNDNETASVWNDLYQKGDAQKLRQLTQVAIDRGPDGKYYAEALLYRGLAEIKLDGGDLKLAEQYLLEAEKASAQLNSIDAAKEQTLLYRGLMVTSLKLGQPDRANKYRDRAIEISPQLKEEILAEFNNAAR